MAVTTSPWLNDLFEIGFVVDTDADATIEKDVRGGTTTVHQVYVNNPTGNATSYLKLYDHRSPTAGTTAPDFEFMVPTNTIATFHLGTAGVEFANGLSFACSTAAGTPAGSNPTNNVTVRIICT